MIAFEPPYHVIDGYALLPDHANRAAFYAIPSAPRLARTGDGRPAFSLLEYLGGGAGDARVAGGLLTLSTELPVPAEALAAIRTKLAGRLQVPANQLQLSPAMFDSGAVELIALGGSSAGRPAGPFQITFLGSGKPSGTGTNGAAFQLTLDTRAAELVEGCLDLPEQPILVVYRMQLAGLRPSFAVTVQADWRSVYRSVQHRANVNVYYVAADVESKVSEALEENNLRVDTTVFGVGEGERGAAERARKQLIDWVTGRLFEPIHDPRGGTAGAIAGAIDDTVWSLARSLIPGVGYRLRMMDDEQLRLMSAWMNESVAERREVVIQGALGEVFRTLPTDPGWPTLRASLVQKINLNGFPRLEVKVKVEDRFASDGLSKVVVELARVRGDGTRTDPRSFAFRTAAEQEDYLVNLLGDNQVRLAAPYDYRVEAHFDPSGPFGSHPPADTGWLRGTTPELYAEPRDAYAIHQVRVAAAPTFSFGPYPAVTVELRYTEDGHPPQAGRVVLRQDSANQVWRFRAFTRTPRPFDYRITYHRTPGTGPDQVSPWAQQIEDWLSVPDPLPTKLTLDLFVDLPWPEVRVAFVEVRYADEANAVRFDDRIDLTADTPYVRRDYPIAATGPRGLEHRLTLLRTRGGLVAGSWRPSPDGRIVIDRRLVEEKFVSVRALGGGLAENGLAGATVELAALDPANGQPRASTQLRFLPGGPLTASWEYLLGDPPARRIRYQATFVDTNGFATAPPPAETNADLLVVRFRERTITG